MHVRLVLALLILTSCRDGPEADPSAAQVLEESGYFRVRAVVHDPDGNGIDGAFLVRLRQRGLPATWWGQPRLRAEQGLVDQRVRAHRFDEAEPMEVELRLVADPAAPPEGRMRPSTVTTDPASDLRWVGKVQDVRLDDVGDLDLQLGRVTLRWAPLVATLDLVGGGLGGKAHLWCEGEGAIGAGPPDVGSDRFAWTTPIEVPTDRPVHLYSWERSSSWVGRIDDLGFGGVLAFHAHRGDTVPVRLGRILDVRIHHADDGGWKGRGSHGYLYAIVPAEEYVPPEPFTGGLAWLNAQFRTGATQGPAKPPVRGYSYVDEDRRHVFLRVPEGEYVVEVWWHGNHREPILAERVWIGPDSPDPIVVGG